MEQAIAPQMATPPPDAPTNHGRSWYGRIPLYVKIMIALVLGVIVGVVLPKSVATFLNWPGLLILRLLGAIAPPLILTDAQADWIAEQFAAVLPN